MAQKIYASRNWCHMHAHQFWWMYLFRFRRYCYLQKQPNLHFWPWTIVHCHQKIQSTGISSKKSCKYNLMSNACTPILVGVAILVLEILLPLKTAKFPFLTMDFNRSKSTQKNHASMPWCQMHKHQFWWVWPFWFRRYCYFQKRPNFPFWPWTIVHGHQKIESIGISSKKIMQV